MPLSVPYTPISFGRQTSHLQKELLFLGVDLPYNEVARISFLGRRKYDRYDHFYPGETFDTRLLTWLGNFEKDERQDAMEIVKSLKFVSSYELKQLAIRTFEQARTTIIQESNISGLDWYTYLERKNVTIETELAKSIFVACADDIDFDFFRRYAMRHYKSCGFKKENFVEYYKRDSKSLEELPNHNRIFLLDQLCATGDTALRQDKESNWHGKLSRFQELWGETIDNTQIYYCPYMLASVAENNMSQRLPVYLKRARNPQLKLLPGCWIPISDCISDQSGTSINKNSKVAKLCEKYYSRFREDKHTKVGGSACYGYGSAGLTIILQSNCPNDTLYLLWHDSDWYPLFPRVAHHTGGEQ